MTNLVEKIEYSVKHQRKYATNCHCCYYISKFLFLTTHIDDVPILKSVTVKSRTKVYKQKVAVTDTTTFASIIAFAIKAAPPPGKQFVIGTVDGSLEYIPGDIVRNVIVDVEHAEVLVSLENARDIDFVEF